MSKSYEREIRQRMEQKSNDELLAIWTKNDHDEWSDEAFLIIKDILNGRDIQLPAQEVWPRPLPIFETKNVIVKKISKWFFLGSVAFGWGIANILIIFGNIQIKQGNPSSGLSLIGLSFLPMIYGGILMAVLSYKMWAAIQDGHARTSPGKAIGFMFIPFYDIYWVFQVIWGFSKDYNKYIERHGVNTGRLPEWLFLTYPILCFTTWIPALLIPSLTWVLTIINYVIGLVMVSEICDGINAIAENPSQ